jgi:hypothetical protein
MVKAPGILETIGEMRAEARARVEKYGLCYFGRHGLFGATPAASRRVVGNDTGVSGYTTPGAPVIFICDRNKCLTLADLFFQGRGYRDCTYTELPL